MDISSNEEEFVCLPDRFVTLDSKQTEKRIELALRKKIINKKRLKWKYANVRYWLIEKSGPIRHSFRALLAKK